MRITLFLLWLTLRGRSLVCCISCAVLRRFRTSDLLFAFALFAQLPTSMRCDFQALHDRLTRFGCQFRHIKSHIVSPSEPFSFKFFTSLSVSVENLCSLLADLPSTVRIVMDSCVLCVRQCFLRPPGADLRPLSLAFRPPVCICVRQIVTFQV